MFGRQPLASAVARDISRGLPLSAKLLFAALAAALSTAAVAESVAPLPAALQSADPQRAEPLVKKCAKCHGDEGVSDDPEVPHLAGQSASYMYTQLQAFKEDTREGGRMNKTAKKLNDQDMGDLVALFAARSLPEEPDVQVPEAPALVSEGDAGRGIDACADCHGAEGRGKRDKYDAPALAGMPLAYFIYSMQGFRDGSRNNDPDGVMGKAAKSLAKGEIETLAQYYLALGKRKPMPPL